MCVKLVFIYIIGNYSLNFSFFLILGYRIHQIRDLHSLILRPRAIPEGGQNQAEIKRISDPSGGFQPLSPKFFLEPIDIATLWH